MTVTKSAANRQDGKHQVDAQRGAILDAAERLFLARGIENTSMLEIARHANINKVTLYRYFANRDTIAVQIQVRMLERVRSAAGLPDAPEGGLEEYKRRVQAMIRNFEALRDAYRYIGMFDKIYLDNASDLDLPRWTKDQLIASDWGREPLTQPATTGPLAAELGVILSTVTWFLEKLALRGELTWSPAGTPLSEDLRIFEELILGYLDRLS
jgi:AcrR family transcriptional regulator